MLEIPYHSWLVQNVQIFLFSVLLDRLRSIGSNLCVVWFTFPSMVVKKLSLPIVIYQNCLIYGCFLYLKGNYKSNFSCSNLLEQNHVEVICKIEKWNKISSSYEPINPKGSLKGCGVHVKCICCPKKSSTPYLPFLSAIDGGRSSFVPDDTDS